MFCLIVFRLCVYLKVFENFKFFSINNFFFMKFFFRNFVLFCDKILIFVLSILIYVVKMKIKIIFMIKRGKKVVLILF